MTRVMAKLSCMHAGAEAAGCTHAEDMGNLALAKKCRDDRDAALNLTSASNWRMQMLML